MKKIALAVVASLVLVTGCRAGGVRRVDPNETENVTMDWGRTDIQETVQVMVDDLLLKNQSELSGRPYVLVDKVANKTEEYVDTKNITEMLRSKLMDSGQVRFTTEKADRAAMMDEVQVQENSGAFAKTPKRAATGNWIPPEFILRGRVSAIYKRNEDVKDVYYQITLQLESINQAAFIWSKTSKIAKQQDR
jgi:penicillin-binding protein activator